MTIKELIKGVEVVKTIGKTTFQVKDVVCDSKDVNSGSMFICINGENYDGHNYARQVEQYGGVAIVTEKRLDCNLTQIIVKNTRKAMGIIASNFYNKPEKELKIIGVTGTNGKTTTTHLIANIINDNGIPCGVIGTLGSFFENHFIEPSLTTPDPLVLYKIFRQMCDCGVKVVVMEVSAHALYYDKLIGLNFEIAIFTNLTQDHLDFFKDMESYKKAKLKLYTDNKVKYALVNADDSLGLDICKYVEKCVFYGMENPADVFAINVEQKKLYTQFVINLFDCIHKVKIKLKGIFNVYNSLAAAASCSIIGVPTDKVCESLAKIKGISGRMEEVFRQDFSIFIDYAHTPDGLQKSLIALKQTIKGRIICVFGCGGNRDSIKREKMGEVSGELADFTVITTDNPRFEDPMDIIIQIEKGVLSKTKKYVIIQDRIQAIEYAIKIAKIDDAILIAGKGSEKYQEVLGIKKPYNDKDTVENIMRK